MNPINSQRADALYFNGTILTMNDEQPVAEAVAVNGEKIIAVGSYESLKLLAGSTTVMHDLQGKTMIPGFYDAHGHFFFNSRRIHSSHNIASPPLGPMTCVSEIVEKLKAVARNTKKGEWIMGECYDDTLLKEGRAPYCHELDEISTEHPVFCYHASYHVASVNSMVLNMAGYTKDTPDPQGGRIRKDPVTGEPNGVLEEPDAMNPVLSLMPRPGREELNAAIRTGSLEYARNGVTTAQDNWVFSDIGESLLAAQKSGDLLIRVMMFPEAAYAMELANGEKTLDVKDNPALKLSHAKLFSDGSIQCYTGYLTQPYYTAFQGDANYIGYPVHQKEDLNRKVKELHDAGYSVAIHGNGDAGIDDVLDAFEKAQAENPRNDTRFQVIHAQMAREDQLDRMKRLGATPTFFPAHCYYWGDRHRDIFIGPERAKRISPAKSAIEKGLRFSIHCDAPVVPINPLMLAWCAVNRITYGNKILGGEQRISVMDALKATTIESAWQCFEEKERGSIETGKYADFAILSDNPLDVPETLKDIKVLTTILNGKTIFNFK